MWTTTQIQDIQVFDSFSKRERPQPVRAKREQGAFDCSFHSETLIGSLCIVDLKIDQAEHAANPKVA
jgi:hypothetical protein